MITFDEIFACIGISVLYTISIAAFLLTIIYFKNKK